MDLLLKVMVIVGLVFLGLAAFKVPEKGIVAYGWMGVFLIAIVWAVTRFFL